MLKNSGSSEQLDADGDTASEVSSEVSFSYEFAQTEVMMKALGSNGERRDQNVVVVFFSHHAAAHSASDSTQTPCRRSSSLWRGSMRRRSGLRWSDRDRCMSRSSSSFARSSTQTGCPQARLEDRRLASKDRDSSLTTAAWRGSAWEG